MSEYSDLEDESERAGVRFKLYANFKEGREVKREVILEENIDWQMKIQQRPRREVRSK